MGQYLTTQQCETSPTQTIVSCSPRKPASKRKEHDSSLIESESKKCRNSKVTESDLDNFEEASFRLKFVSREVEANTIVQTLKYNREAESLSETKVPCLFQTLGIGKTSLVQKFRQVYEETKGWDGSTLFIRDMKLLFIDWRYSQNEFTDSDEKLREVILSCYEKQFVQDTTISVELRNARKQFYDLTLQLQKSASNIFSCLDSLYAPESYLVFLDDLAWTSTEDLQKLFLSVSSLAHGKRSSIIIGGHAPFQNRMVSDVLSVSTAGFKMIFLSHMNESKLQILLEKTEVALGGKSTTLIQALKLVGLQDEKLFISILHKYTGTVPRIMKNALVYLLERKKRLDTKEQIEAVFSNRACQKARDVTMQIQILEQAILLSKLFILFCFDIPIPVSAVVSYNGREQFLIELLPMFLIHFELKDDLIYLIIPKIIQHSFVSSLSHYSPYIGVRNKIIDSYVHEPSFDKPKFLELAVIDILVDRIRFKFLENNMETEFGEVCKGIFKNSFFSSLTTPKQTTKELIPGMLTQATASSCEWLPEVIFTKYLCHNTKSLSFILENLNKSYCFAIPAPLNTGFDCLFTLDTVKKLMLLEMKLNSDKSFNLTHLQTEIDQVSILLPYNTVNTKPSLEGDALSITLVMVVFGYCESILDVIDKNGTNGSLLISGTCYLDSDNTIQYEPNTIGQSSWLKIQRGGLEVLLLNEEGLKNLLGDDVFTFFKTENNMEELYKKFISSETYSQQSLNFQ